jgi:hypothetical protein
VGSLRVHVLKVPKIVMSRLRLGNLVVRLGLASVDNYRGVSNALYRSYISHPPSGNFMLSWMKKTGMLFPTISQLPSSV